MYFLNTLTCVSSERVIIRDVPLKIETCQGIE
jgi:hypothetical protein